MATISYSFSTPKLSTLHYSRNFKTNSCLSLNQPSAKTTNASAAAAASETLKVAFAAGGTGGHISPAVAIADELKNQNPDIQILFIGTPTGMESAAVPFAGYPFVAIPAAPLARPLISVHNIFILPFLLTKSLVKSFQTLQEFSPQIVIGTGGYVSFPICLAAAMKGLKLVIQEQNSVPGIANWVLSLFAERVFVAFNSSVDCFWQRNKCIVCGNPVRFSLSKNVVKADARKHFFPKAVEGIGKGQGKVVLVLGGSLGASAINIALLNSYYEMLNQREDLFIIWQTGVESFDEMESLVKNHPRLILKSFLHSMHLAYAAADLIISRAGAMTCSEILATGKPCILIPSPNVDEGHQLKNAFLMADLAGSRVITEDELDSTTLRTAVEEILDNESLMVEMSQRALQAAKPNASIEIAQYILSVVSSSK
ncbi:uncharacterized protein LOC113768258 isoform X1 [Coffea eugenioides]|uniref:uncharacterized protein LOC113768258 isoform X1 n=1 Tax=Coffea eugenioides TaxID=49369 RepID=UPI000F60CF60|nr:uncharacterized protein LOC113768258 isoform X1 [Coffea eugenioides]